MTRIIIDTETTGLNAALDEILQLAIIDADTGDLLHERLYGTLQRKEWPGAEAVNCISPKLVSGLPSLYDDGEQATAAEIIGAADWVGGWNVDFDLSMLWAYKIAPRDDAQIVDVMKLDAEICGTLVPFPDGVKWRKLANAATWWGFDLASAPGVYHNAETDCLATRHVWQKIMQWKKSVWNTRNRAVYLDARNMMRDIMTSCRKIQTEMLGEMCDPDNTTLQPDEVKTRLQELQEYLKFLSCLFEFVSDCAEMSGEDKKKKLREVINRNFGVL